MAFEDGFFEKKAVQWGKLLPFGFVQVGENYAYRSLFMDGNFEARVTIHSDGQVSGQVHDVELDEEYTAFRVERHIGNFVGQVREEYGTILENIASACFEAQPFYEAQTNRLAAYLTKTFGDQTDHPFAKFPNFTAFRHPANQKWYGLVGRVLLARLQLGDENWSPEALKQEVEIINIKVKPEEVSSLLAQDGMYPSYHMSKKTWVTIVLDGRVPDEVLFGLVSESRNLVGPKSFVSADGPDYWVIPANPKVFDIDSEFAENKVVYWKQKATIQAGDIVAMYITAPVRAIRYVCRVLEAQIDNRLYPEEDAKKLMKVELIDTFGDEVFPIERMKELGVKAVRGPRRLTKELRDALVEKLEASKKK